jgi:hypothetical protein
MDLMEVLGQVRELLQKKGRITYRLLQAQFHLDNEALEALREELIEAEQIAVDEDDKVLVWVGDSPVLSSKLQVQSSIQPSAPSSPSI